MKHSLYWFWLFFTIFALITASLFAQSAQADELQPYSLVQVPRAVYIGDWANLHFLLKHEGLQEGEVKIQFADPASGRQSIEIKDIQAEFLEDSLKIDIQLRAWEVGSLQLPVLLVGEREVRGLFFTVSSVWEGSSGTRELAGMRGALFPPGTRLLLIVLALTITLVLPFLLLLRLRLLPGLAAYLARRPRRRMLRRLERLVRQIATKSKNEDQRLNQLQAFSVELRSWLSLLSSTNCASFTANELLRLYQIDSELFSAEQLKPYRQFFSFFDLLRFSRQGRPQADVVEISGACFRACQKSDELLCQREGSRAPRQDKQKTGGQA